MASRRFLLSTLFFPLAASSLALSGDHPPQRPNILFLLADDMRPDAASCLGNPAFPTPSLDRLAARGIVLSNAHIMGGLQGAVCVPSRAMVLSGRSLFRVDEQLRDTPTWPMRLREAGYATHATGKWHNGVKSAALSFPGARAIYPGGMLETQFRPSVLDLAPDGRPTPRRTLERHASEVFADEAIRFLDQPHDQPWALYVAFTAPHDPRDAPADIRARFDPETMPLPPNFLPEHPFDNGELRIRDELLEAFPRSPAAIRRHLADYAAIIAHLDAQIGRILEALDRTGKAGNTLVVFAADNGLAIGSHGLMGKQSVYEHSTGIPLIAAGPDIPPGRRSDALCYLLDLGATFCELAGVAPPEHGDGLSLWPVLAGQRIEHRESLVFAYRQLMRGYRDDRWKVAWYPPLDRWQLFDLENDPFETRDLASEPAHANRLTELKSRLHSLRRDFGDTL